MIRHPGPLRRLLAGLDPALAAILAAAALAGGVAGVAASDVRTRTIADPTTAGGGPASFTPATLITAPTGVGGRRAGTIAKDAPPPATTRPPAADAAWTPPTTTIGGPDPRSAAGGPSTTTTVAPSTTAPATTAAPTSAPAITAPAASTTRPGRRHGHTPAPATSGEAGP